MANTLGIIVVAAGSGTRLGAVVPKAFVNVAGSTILARAVASLPEAQVVLVVPADRVDSVSREFEAVTVVAGSDTRQKSVAAGIAALDPEVETVLVHDAARALTPLAQFDLVATAVRERQHGVIPVLPVSDTIKRRSADATANETVDRSDLVLVQTPQGFPRAALVTAYAAATADHTDDAALFAAAGGVVETVPGDAMAFKITTPADLRRAEQELGADMQIRTGVGMDVHAYDAAEPMWLGGLYWPDEVGLSGHSDGDAMSHAICDALLSAAGLGDIGGRFGTSDPKFAGAHGEVFLRATIELVQGAGYSVGNVSVQLIANGPRLGDRRMELEQHLTELVGAPVSIAATTSDGLGFTGKGEGVAVIATALVTHSG